MRLVFQLPRFFRRIYENARSAEIRIIGYTYGESRQRRVCVYTYIRIPIVYKRMFVKMLRALEIAFAFRGDKVKRERGMELNG